MYFTYLYLTLFLGIVYLLYRLAPLKGKWLVLLGASLAFYCAVSEKMIIFLALSIGSIYGGALLLERLQSKGREKKLTKQAVKRRQRAVLAVVLGLNFGLLAYLKYYNFFGYSLNRLLGHPLSSLRIQALLPLGISYYTLQGAGYLLDVYYQREAADKNPGRVALFLCFFPQMVQGPIGRYGKLAGQLYQGHAFDYQEFTFGLQLIGWGVFKKVVLADRANMLVHRVFDNPGYQGGIFSLAAVLLFTYQIYMDFSGCIDVAVGSAQIFGIRLSPNFARPFFSKSIGEFWRRWHITLGSWFKDYIFYPVSMSKSSRKLGKKARKRFPGNFSKVVPAAYALFFVWFCTGLWHGAAWKYIFYGMYYYCLMILGMLCRPVTDAVLKKAGIYGLFQMLRTFLLVNIGMLIFRARGLHEAWQILKGIFTGFSLEVVKNGSFFQNGLGRKDFLILAFGAVLVLIVSIYQERGGSVRLMIAQKAMPVRWAACLGMLCAIMVFGAYGFSYSPADMIYAQF